MLTEITTVFTQVLTWLGQFVGELTGADGSLVALWPLMALGIGVSLCMVIIKIIRRITWGA